MYMYWPNTKPRAQISTAEFRLQLKSQVGLCACVYARACVCVWIILLKDRNSYARVSLQDCFIDVEIQDIPYSLSDFVMSAIEADRALIMGHPVVNMVDS